jgi:hypothetical protein
LRLVPSQADLIIRVDDPRQVMEALVTLAAVQEALGFQAAQELLDSTNVHRLKQLIGYLEKKLGLQGLNLLDAIAGGGMVFAVQFGPDPAPGLLVVQGRNQVTVQALFPLALEVIGQELARSESKDRLEKGTYRKIATAHVGAGFYTAAVGAAILVSNQEKALHKAVDLYLDGKGGLQDKAEIKEARKLLPEHPLAWMWLNFGPLHASPQAKEVFAKPRNDVNLTVLFGGWLEVASKSPFLCAALVREHTGLRVTVRMPCGREGTPPELAAHIPPANEPGTLPLVEPHGVLYSTSLYLDISKFWEYRTKLFNEKQIKSFEEFDKKAAPFLVGNRPSKLFHQLGTHVRFFTAFRPPASYDKVAPQPLSLFAYGAVLDMRDPAFGKNLETLLRGAGLLLSFQYKLQLTEEMRGNVKIVGYRLPEELSGGEGRPAILYRATPCFAAVGNQICLCSSLELAREVVDWLGHEAGAKAPKANSFAVQTELHATGGADFLQAIEGQLLAQTILNQALSPAEAQKQVRLFLDWVRRLGTVKFEVNYGAHDFHVDLVYSGPEKDHKQKPAE